MDLDKVREKVDKTRFYLLKDEKEFKECKVLEDEGYKLFKCENVKLGTNDDGEPIVVTVRCVSDCDMHWDDVYDYIKWRVNKKS